MLPSIAIKRYSLEKLQSFHYHFIQLIGTTPILVQISNRSFQSQWTLQLLMKYQKQFKGVQKKLFINGKLIDSQGGSTFPIFSPSTESIIGHGVAATYSDVNAAVLSARKAFQSKQWRKMDPHSRGRLLYKLADLIQENIEILSYFETLNSGKPLSVSKNQDIPYTAYVYRYFAGQTDKIKGSTLAMSTPFFGYTRKQPIGVIAQIIPWNYPLLMMAWKVAPALAAGCTVVLKPAEQTPITALLLGQLFVKAGFPPGVINIITGLGKTGEALSQHGQVDKISFTGSTQVGYLIMRNSHKINLKPVTLELGGKSANIILPDADLDEAASHACILFANCGQSCIAGSRTYVHSSIYDAFISKCVQIANKIKVGDPFDQTSQIGAIISIQQFQKILSYIQIGKKQGAKLVAGGLRVGHKGYFIRPTIFTDVTQTMRIGKQEIFGPVMSIFKWTDDEDVIKRANSLPYGLGAGVVTRSIDKAMKFTERLHAGTVYVNCYDYQQACTPFGGVKDSGIGKDLGDEGLQSYLVTKTVVIRPNL